jgi:hypothetical protein
MLLAGYSCYSRITDRDHTDTVQNDDLYSQVTGGKLGQFTFFVKYAVELFLSWFLYFPIFGTLMFSGILGCGGRLPILGGRPRDKKLIEQELAEQRHSYASF